MSDIRIVLIEDHDVVRIGLRTALQSQNGIRVVGEAINGVQGLKLLQTTPADVALVDIGLPGMDGIEMTKQFRQFQSDSPEATTKILMLTMQSNEDAVLASFASGADSYCIKDIGVDRLTEAIQMTHEGSAWIDPAIASVVLRQMRQAMPQSELKRRIEIHAVDPDLEEVLAADPLTDREREVLELMVAGCTNIAIAEKLYITVGTVKTHVRNILAKLCADDRTEAAVRALRSGIVS
ncbi:MAG: response regulator transcription factor [Aphanocapsa sp. GSE-SYN-MK-11-07L]|jgi:DNA-binding NarL/FixJ family response regulator|nr:response regulator transcription factor [Aphanocapsa sp. GSE-SYN-MK-11-07L]